MREVFGVLDEWVGWQETVRSWEAQMAVRPNVQRAHGSRAAAQYADMLARGEVHTGILWYPSDDAEYGSAEEGEDLMRFRPGTVVIPASECPCEGTGGWKWHSGRGIPQCAHSRTVKNKQWHKRNKALLDAEEEDPGNTPWRTGSRIYFDEREVRMA